MPIATPMSARLKGGGVVHAVAGHGHEMPFVLQRFDDIQLLFRGDPRA
jgi:hypothetical protein